MEGRSTLTDALLNDLDDLSDYEEGDDDVNDIGQVEHGRRDDQTKKEGAGYGSNSSTTDTKPNAIIRCSLLENFKLQNHLKVIREKNDAIATTNSVNALKEESIEKHATSKEALELEHQLIVQSNQHLGQLAEELTRAHSDLCEAYHAKFPELEELIPNPISYMKAVQVMGQKEMDMTRVQDRLEAILSNHQIITISVAASTTGGRPLTDEEWKKVLAAKTNVEEIVAVQQELTGFVQDRMEGLAPSICALVGPQCAAQLLGLAGGLGELARIPACNLQVMGQVKQTQNSRAAAGWGMNHALVRHQGVLATCSLVQSSPKALQKKTLKQVAGKLALVARCDFANVDSGRPRSAAPGLTFRQEILDKIAKWQEPDKAPVLKALPKMTLDDKRTL